MDLYIDPYSTYSAYQIGIMSLLYMTTLGLIGTLDISKSSNNFKNESVHILESFCISNRYHEFSLHDMFELNWST